MSFIPARFLLVATTILVFLSPSLNAQTRRGHVIQILVSFDYPFTSQTTPHGINQRGDVTGDFVDSNGLQGFIRYQDGTFSPPIVHPDDTDGETSARDINRSAIIGYRYDLATYVFHSFGLSRNQFTDLDLPNVISTVALGLNASGNYCGQFDDGSGVFKGFLVVSGQVTKFALPMATFTTANAISADNSVAGVYDLTDNHNHGFIRDATGNLSYPIDFPGATDTAPRGINWAGSSWAATIAQILSRMASFRAAESLPFI